MTASDQPEPDVARYMAAAKADSTRETYAKSYRDFVAWCANTGLDAEHPSEMTVARYLVAIAQKVSRATVLLRSSAIMHALREKGQHLNPAHPVLRNTLQGIRRVHREPGRRAMAFMVDDIRRILAICGDDLRGARDRALILVGFAGAFRCSELVGIDVEHLHWTPARLNILVPASKEDQLGRGEYVIMPRGKDPTTCAMSAMQEWLRLSGITHGPLFRGIPANSNSLLLTRLSGKSVNRIVQDRAMEARLDIPEGRYISSHAMRAGFITEAFRAGITDEEIMGHTRHRSLASMRGYVRRERLGNDSPAGRIGL